MWFYISVLFLCVPRLALSSSFQPSRPLNNGRSFLFSPRPLIVSLLPNYMDTLTTPCNAECFAPSPSTSITDIRLADRNAKREREKERERRKQKASLHASMPVIGGFMEHFQHLSAQCSGFMVHFTTLLSPPSFIGLVFSASDDPAVVSLPNGQQQTHKGSWSTKWST